MPKLHIPRLGDKVQLAAPWSFRLYDEHRNSTLIRHIYGTIAWNDNRLLTDPSPKGEVFKVPIVLPVGTELTVRRIFIRQGARDFDSVTFTATLLPLKPAARGKVGKPAKVRFWAKLDDVNTMQIVHIGGIASAPATAVVGEVPSEQVVADPCPGCPPGSKCRTPACGRLNQPVVPA